MHANGAHLASARDELNWRARHAEPDRDFGADRHQFEMARERARDPFVPLVAAVITHAFTQQATAHADTQARLF
jgi:hypothetical protein